MRSKGRPSGRDVYRRMGWRGEPTTSELKNPERNISMARRTEHSGKWAAGRHQRSAGDAICAVSLFMLTAQARYCVLFQPTVKKAIEKN